MIGRGGTVDNSQRWYGEARTGEVRTVELVEPESAVGDEGRLAVAWQGVLPVTS